MLTLPLLHGYLYDILVQNGCHQTFSSWMDTRTNCSLKRCLSINLYLFFLFAIDFDGCTWSLTCFTMRFVTNKNILLLLFRNRGLNSSCYRRWCRIIHNRALQCNSYNEISEVRQHSGNLYGHINQAPKVTCPADLVDADLPLGSWECKEKSHLRVLQKSL